MSDNHVPSQDDAQIGVDVLGWRQTIAGVGHCRQVGCPESGIDDAVQRLASLGYKVFRAASLCLAITLADAVVCSTCSDASLVCKVHCDALLDGLVTTKAPKLQYAGCCYAVRGLSVLCRVLSGCQDGADGDCS